MIAIGDTVQAMTGKRGVVVQIVPPTGSHSIGRVAVCVPCQIEDRGPIIAVVVRYDPKDVRLIESHTNKAPSAHEAARLCALGKE